MKVFVRLVHRVLLFVVLPLSLLALGSCSEDGSPSLVNKLPGEFSGEFPAEFPLTIDLAKTTFAKGETISLKATITNNSGKDVNIMTNGCQPAVWLTSPGDDESHAEILLAFYEVFRAGETITQELKFTKGAGRYLLHVEYEMYTFVGEPPVYPQNPIDGSTLIKAHLDDIVITVK